MKVTVFKIVIIFLFLITTIGTGCQKDAIELADENIEISGSPGFSIYKTNGDYFNFVTVVVVSDNELSSIPDYTLNSPSIKVDSKGRISPSFRWRLKNGYILELGPGGKQAFTNITIHEYVDYNTAHGVACMPDNLIWKRIIDRDPYTEFYSHDGWNKTPKTYKIGEINDLIESGRLEAICTKLK